MTVARKGSRLRVLLLLTALLLPRGAFGEERAPEDLEFNRREVLERRGNLFDLLFGSPPPLASERGLLLVAAFLDGNGNGSWEEGETILRNEVTCTLGGIDYRVPAFIPGLEPEKVYLLACSGGDFRPRPAEREIFFKRRGEILRVALACDPVDEANGPTPGREPRTEDPESKR